MCEMGHHGHHPGGGMKGHGCCSGGPMGHHHAECCSGRGWRRFISPAEEIERLKEYLEELKKEMAGVEARLHELKGNK